MEALKLEVTSAMTPQIPFMGAHLCQRLCECNDWLDELLGNFSGVSSTYSCSAGSSTGPQVCSEQAEVDGGGAEGRGPEERKD